MSEIAVFGAGCFWGVEERFRQQKGVLQTEVGYCGGELPETDYKAVCTGNTGHAEVVMVEFNPEVITYNELLNLFWSSHNPTLLNRQGPDVGTQYRSVIFYTTEEQAQIAMKSLSDYAVNGPHNKPIVTQIVEINNYVKAEEYHQKYLHKRGHTSCAI